MECIGCGNCQQDQATYCVMRNGFVVAEQSTPREKVRLQTGKRATRNMKNTVVPVGI